MAFIKNKYFQSILLFVVIVVGYGVFEYFTFVPEVIAPTEEVGVVHTIDDSMEAVEVEVVDIEEIDLAGTHIMRNGDVMTGAGIVLPDAEILEDGNVQLVNGEIITPVVDFRK